MPVARIIALCFSKGGNLFRNKTGDFKKSIGFFGQLQQNSCNQAHPRGGYDPEHTTVKCRFLSLLNASLKYSILTRNTWISRGAFL